MSTINRDDFISIAQGESLKSQPLRIVESFDQLKGFAKGLVAVWTEKPEQPRLPNLLLLPKSEKKDLFAWANTYVKIKPLTAFVRTLDFETVSQLSKPPSNTERWESGIIGLILAEALTYLDQASIKLTLRACEGTYSFGVARSLLRVEGPRGVRQTGLNWFRSREALGNRATRLALVHLQGVWSVIAQLVGSETQDASQPIVRSCNNLLETGDISDSDWRALTLDMPVYDLRMAMQDTREERVRLLEGFLQSLGNRSSAKEETAFLVGYLVSLVAPGTLDHWRLLNPVSQSIPTAGLWYGLCAGLRRESGVESYGSGVGRLVSRELQRKVDLLEQPTCDIAVDELEVTGPFFKADGPAASNAIEVEVSPGVSVPFRSNGTDQMRTDFRLEPPPRVNEHPLDPMILENLDDAIYALQEVKRSIQKSIPYSDRGSFRKQRKKQPSR
ncbi:MAG TPA: hypothetical protein VE135_26145 [Pyrinomonadaceae bacterium]|nr:hypothetical protein [Pyrinomonadaceae bacterium]